MDRTRKMRIVAVAAAVFIILIITAGIGSRADYALSSLRESGKVAVIRVDGPIIGGDGEDFALSRSAAAASGDLMRQFRKARKDEDVKAVLLRINSPGGSAAATQEAAAELQRLKDAGKPVVVSMGDTAASGAYWLAAYGDKVYANPSTITGSIGVYMSYYDLQGLSQKIGVSEQKIKSGEHKDMFSPFRPMTGEEQQLTQAMVDAMYNQFVAVVAKERHMDEATVRSLADGRVFTGEQAKKEGLVDELGNYYDALAYAGELIDADPDNVPVVIYNNAPSLQQLVKGNVFSMPFWQSAVYEDGRGFSLPVFLMKGVWQQ